MATNLRSNILIRLGLISFPINVQSAVSEDKESNLKVVCIGGLPVKDDKGVVMRDKDGKDILAVHDPVKIKQTIACPHCTREGNIYSFPRGKDNGDGTFNMISDEQQEAVAAQGLDVKDTISLTAHPAAEVNQQTLPGEKRYYLSPGQMAGEIYPMMVGLIKSRPDIAFCAVWAVKSAPAMYQLGVYEDTLVLYQLAWPDSVNQVPAKRTTSYPAELLALAQSSIDTLMMPFDPSTYKDGRQEVLRQFLNSNSKVAGGVTAVADAAESLLVALRAAATPVKVPKPRAPRKPAAKKATVTNIKERKTA